MDQFLTVCRKDPQFRKYLEGRIPKGHRLLPVKSFGVRTESERVTFQVVPFGILERPHILGVFGRLFRLEWLILSLGPAITTVLYVAANPEIFSRAFALLGMTAVVCLQWGTFCFNDYIDHIRGHDRLGSQRGSSVIRHGWLAAYQVRNLALGMWAVGAVLSMPVLCARPVVLWGSSLFVASAVILYPFLKRSIFHRGLRDILVFLSFGPVLTWGMAQAAGAEASDLRVLALGVVFGLLGLLYWQIRQLESLMGGERERFLVRLGIDRGKTLLCGEVAVHALLLSGFLFWESNGSLFTFFALAVLLPLYLLVFRNLKQIRSPVSSSLFVVRRRFLLLHLGCSCTLVLFYLQALLAV